MPLLYLVSAVSCQNLPGIFTLVELPVPSPSHALSHAPFPSAFSCGPLPSAPACIDCIVQHDFG